MLLLGSRHDEVTLLHYAEHIAPFEGKRMARYKVPILGDGARVWIDCEEFDTTGQGVHPNWPHNAFELIVDDFIAKSAKTSLCRQDIVRLTNSVCFLMPPAWFHTPYRSCAAGQRVRRPRAASTWR